MDHFAVVYDGLVNEDDDNLTEDSRQLRDALKALVGSPPLSISAMLT
jgi:hypothetical protein